MHKIAILYTTFLRDELLEKTIPSILNYMPENATLFIADQGVQSQEKDTYYQSLPKNKVKYWYLNFDCGLSFSRNFLVTQAKSMNYDYCFLVADSMEFIKPFKPEPIICFLESHKDYGIVGFKLNKRISWEKNIKLDEKEERFVIQNSTEKLNHKDIDFLRCDIVRNFFLAKTQVLYYHKWDEELKLGEHEIFFWNLKTKSYWKTFYTEYYAANYIDFKPSYYRQMRARLQGEFLPLFLKKYNLKYWLKYE